MQESYQGEFLSGMLMPQNRFVEAMQIQDHYLLQIHGLEPQYDQQKLIEMDDKLSTVPIESLFENNESFMDSGRIHTYQISDSVDSYDYHKEESMSQADFEEFEKPYQQPISAGFCSFETNASFEPMMETYPNEDVPMEMEIEMESVIAKYDNLNQCVDDILQLTKDQNNRDRETKKRQRKDGDQRSYLENEYKKNPNWTREFIEQLAHNLGLSESQVYKWQWDQKHKESKAYSRR